MWSVAKFHVRLCNPMDCRMSGFPVLHYLPEFAQTHVHWVSDAIQPSHLLLPPLLLPSVFPSIRVFSSQSALCIKWPKYWSFIFNISSSSEYSGLISFRIDWLDLPAVQGTLKSLLQHHSLKASVIWHSAFFMVQLSHLYMTTGKIIALIIWTLVGQVMSLLFNTLSRFVKAFLPQGKHLFISWLQSPSAVVLEPKKIKSVTASTFFSICCPEVMELVAMILVFECWVLTQPFSAYTMKGPSREACALLPMCWRQSDVEEGNIC